MASHICADAHLSQYSLCVRILKFGLPQPDIFYPRHVNPIRSGVFFSRAIYNESQSLTMLNKRWV